MPIFTSSDVRGSAVRLSDDNGASISINPVSKVTKGAVEKAVIVGGCLTSVPFLMDLAARSTGSVANWLGASGITSNLQSVSQVALATAAVMGTLALLAPVAYAISANAMHRTAEALAESELRRMSGAEPFMNFASAMKNGDWLVKDAGAKAVPQVMSNENYLTWRDKVDASDVPLVLFAVGNVKKDALISDGFGYSEAYNKSEDNDKSIESVKSNENGKFPTMFACKFKGGKPDGYSDEDPFVRFYWASEKAGFTQTAQDLSNTKQNAATNTLEYTDSMGPKSNAADNSMLGRGILAGNRDTSYNYGGAHSVLKLFEGIGDTFRDGMKRAFGNGRDPVAEANGFLDQIVPSSPRH